MDWRRYGGGPGDNVTVSDGKDTIGGSSCVALVGQWQDDPLSQEQGSYIRSSCLANRPYVCQIYATTKKFQVAVGNYPDESVDRSPDLRMGWYYPSTFANSATLTGGWYSIFGPKSNISSLLLQRGALLTVEVNHCRLI